MNILGNIEIIDQFTVGLVSWTLNGSEAGGDLVLIKTSPLSCVNEVFLSLASWCLNKREKQRGLYQSKVIPASLAFMARQLSTQL